MVADRGGGEGAVIDVDVAVVGGGVMGAAAAWWLARAGAEVVMLERFTIGPAHGASHGRSRIFRLSYPDAGHVRLAEEALPLWRELEAEAGETLLLPTGAWARPLLARAGVELPVTVTRETVAYVAAEGELELPTLVEWGRASHYALASPGEGIKVGVHQATRAVDPDSEAIVDPEAVGRIREWVAGRLPWLGSTPLRVETCLHTSTADERFLLEQHGPLVVGSRAAATGSGSPRSSAAASPPSPWSRQPTPRIPHPATANPHGPREIDM